MNPNEKDEQDIFKTGTSLSTSATWWGSILRQFRQRREDRETPPPTITAAPDASALDKFIKPKSSIASILWTIGDMRKDKTRTLDVTAAPVEVGELWTRDNSGYVGLISIVAHAAILLVIMIPITNALRAKAISTQVTMLKTPPLVMPPMNRPQQKSGGGGGGGRKALTPPSKGVLPRGTERQIAAPLVEMKNMAPELAVESTIVAPQLTTIPLVSVFGDPNGVVGPPSAGPGSGGGIGTGTGTGIGSGRGAGAGPGSGGGIGGGAFQVGGGVSPPALVTQINPEYSDDGRKARIQGTVELSIIVKEDGTVQFNKVNKSLGYGLDEKAIQAVQKWKFRPGKKDGQAVSTFVAVTVNFTLR